MTVSELSRILSLEPLSMPNGERECNTVYIGDLLSRVMGHAAENSVWITILPGINTVAVAALTNVSAILLAEGVLPQRSVIETAREKGINILRGNDAAYELAVRLSALLQPPLR